MVLPQSSDAPEPLDIDEKTLLAHDIRSGMHALKSGLQVVQVVTSEEERAEWTRLLLEQLDQLSEHFEEMLLRVR